MKQWTKDFIAIAFRELALSAQSVDAVRQLAYSLEHGDLFAC